MFLASSKVGHKVLESQIQKIPHCITFLTIVVSKQIPLLRSNYSFNSTLPMSHCSMCCSWQTKNTSILQHFLIFIPVLCLFVYSSWSKFHFVANHNTVSFIHAIFHPCGATYDSDSPLRPCRSPRLILADRLQTAWRLVLALQVEQAR